MAIRAMNESAEARGEADSRHVWECRFPELTRCRARVLLHRGRHHGGRIRRSRGRELLLEKRHLQTRASRAAARMVRGRQPAAGGCALPPSMAIRPGAHLASQLPDQPRLWVLIPH